MAASAAAVPLLAYRDNTGVTVATGPPACAPVQLPDLASEPRSFIYSPLGKYLALVLTDRVQLISTFPEKTELVREFLLPGIQEIEFSPKDNFLSTFVRYVKPEDPDQMHQNVSVWNTETGKEVISFTKKNPNGWSVDWTEDESYAARLVTDEIQIYDIKNLSKGVAYHLKGEGISSFSLSPGKRSIIAAFYSEKNGRPASVKLFDVTSLSQALSEKSFYRADSVQFYWNALGTNVLVFTHTDVDATGQTYYGETSLYYLSITGNFDCKVQLDKPGPIHDVCWHPNSKEFVVVYGTMPAKTTLFDHRANPLFEFGNAARNQVKFNPHGRLLFIGGFGNLPGDMDVWDRKTFKKIASIQASNSSSCDWSPDGRFIMTSTLYKRLKVDNGIKFWHYTGVLVHKIDVKEMHQTSWKPAMRDLWPERNALSPPPPGIAVSPAAKPATKYRPPGLRNAPETKSLYDRDAIDSGVVQSRRRPPGSVPGSTPGAKGNADGKNKRNGAADANGKQPQQANATGIVPGSALEIEKRIKVLNKKLHQIQNIKQKKDEGQVLELNQIQKIESEAGILEELQKLNISLTQ